MAFSALISLRYTLMNLDFLNIAQSEWDDELQWLCHTLERLDDERYRGISRSEINELEAKITEAVWKVEDVIESHQISQGVVDEEGVEQEIHSFLEAAKKLREEYERALKNSRVAEEDTNTIAAAVSQTHDDSTAVGLSDLSEQVITGLLDDDKSHYKMFTIRGMAGIGKTHLAHHIYHHPHIVQHFDLRLWVNIGSKHRDIESIFVGILAQIENKPRDLFMGKNKDELRDLIRSSLVGCGTLFVVFDDVWSPSHVFRACLSALQIYPNVTRILLTTRFFHGTKKKFHTDQFYDQICKMPFLSNEESWDLLSKNVFAEKPVPTQLEKAGRKIAEICEGLPLLILTVADILRGLDQTEEFWNKVAEKKTTTFPDAFDRIYKVLVSSYDYLPQKYKACFLYMGAFLQSHEILVPKLINLWSVENFPGDNETVEELDSCSLAFVCKWSSDSRIKSCKLHCTYWYVCVTEARKSKLFHVLNKLTDVSNERNPRRLAVQNSMLFGLKEVHDSMTASTSLTRSLLFSCEDHQYPIQICFNAMLLLKVLDALAIRFYEFPNEVLSLLNLRYLALTHNGELPCSISQLKRLKFLILRRHHNIKLLMQSESTTYLPKEIWDLQELEYLRIMGSNLPDPNHGIELPKLSRLYVNATSCTKGVLRGTPALKKLGIEIELQPECGAGNSLRFLEHIWILKRLESLKCVVVNPHLSSDQVVSPPKHPTKLPRTLRKLSLKGLGYPWEYISVIGSLPNLEVLKLRCYAFRGPFWKIKDGEFWTLKYLLLEDMDLVHWIVQGHLPQLNDLIIRHCYKLKRISFRYIPNLDWIEVDESSHSTVEFALQQIKDSLNPLDLSIVINCSWNL